MSFGVTPEGYNLKTQDEINADAEDDLREVRDPVTGQALEPDFSNPSDIITPITAIPLEGVGIAFSQNEAAYNAFDPGKATEDALSNLALIHGTERLPASRSTVLLDFTGTPLAFVNEGFQVTDVNREITWTTTQDFTFDGGGIANGVPASCDTLGAISAPASTLINLVSNPSGIVTTVTNPAPATIGRDEETDESLRQRMDISNSKPAFGFPTAINANILNVPGVIFSREYTNNTLITDGNGITGKTLAAVVDGGDDTAVAQAILQSLTSGQLTQGNTAINFTDNLGNIITINFFRPENVLMDVELDISFTGDEVFPSNGVEVIKQAIVDYSTGGAAALGITDGFNTVGFPPGENVLLSRLYTPINSVPGHSIIDLRIGSSSPIIVAPVASDFVINFNQIAVFDVSSIDVSVI
jgi:uncharacterized phage protein gp47/JayE